jgi:uncharacterized spore protein YtfJ
MDATDCMRLLSPLVTEIPVWSAYQQEMKLSGGGGNRSNSGSGFGSGSGSGSASLPKELLYLENAFCDMR